jgi:transcriptional regulator with XRE-family HTH domain
MTARSIRIGTLLSNIKTASGLSVREISSRMGLSGQQAQVQRILNGENITLKTLLRFAAACGYDVKLSFKKRKKA